MAIKAARLKNKNLLVNGVINTRIPLKNKTNLVSVYDFGEDECIGEENQYLIDYRTWVPGSTGSQTGFDQNGTTSENSIIMAEGPFEDKIPCWQALNNDATSNSDGGWTTNNAGSPSNINHLKTYRVSVWFKIVNRGNGTLYFGSYCYSGGSNVGSYEQGSTTANSNDYFSSFATSNANFIEGEWYLFIGHLRPSNDTVLFTHHEDTGFWNQKGEKVASASDSRMHETTNQIRHRNYLYYSTDPTTHVLWCYPKIELVNGSEPTIKQMLHGQTHGLRALTSSNVTFTEEGANINQPFDGFGIQLLNIVDYDETPDHGWDQSLHTDAVALSNWAVGYNAGATDSPNIHHAYLKRLDDGEVVIIGKDLPNPTNGGMATWMGISNQTSLSLVNEAGLSEGDRITLSWDQKSNRLSNGVQAGFYHKLISNGSTNFGNTLQYRHNTKINEWERVSITAIIDSDWDLEEEYLAVYFYFYNEDGGVSMVRRPQLEYVGVNTAYSPTAHRPNNSDLKIQVGDLANCTLFGECILESEAKNNANYTDTLNQSFLFRLVDAVNGSASVFYRHYLSGGTIVSTFLDPDGNWNTSGGSGHIHSLYELDKHVKTYYAIRKTGGTLKLKLWQNGVWKGEHVMSTAANSVISTIEFGGGGPIWNARHKSLNIYDTELSDTELDNLIKSTYSITKEGVSVKKIVTEPPYVDGRYLYYPLSGDSEENITKEKPLEESDTVYLDGGVYCGEGHTNNFEQYSSTWNNSGTSQTYTNLLENPDPDSTSDVHAVEVTSGSAVSVGTVFGQDTSPSQNTIYSVGAWFWIDVNDATNDGPYVREYNTANTGGASKGSLLYNGVYRNFSDLPQRKWIWLEAKNITSYSDSTAIRISFYLSNEGDIVHFTNYMLDYKKYCPPFINYGTTRSANKLRLNQKLNPTNVSYTVMFWVKELIDNTSNATICVGDTLAAGKSYIGITPGSVLIYNGTVLRNISVAGGMDTSKWNLISLQNEVGVGTRLYVNGVLQYTDSGVYYPFDDIGIRTRHSSHTLYNAIIMKDLRFYLGELISSSKMLEIYKMQMREFRDENYLQVNGNIVSGEKLV